ncbi:hypothetical protein [Paeniglutamicibacter sp.]|uniref:hypothetical protein n=1 Tax=Paeniglutamicibacter sp. TaxID=1934391 RepID=UPI003988B27F
MILAVAALVALTGCSASPSEPLTADTKAPVSASASTKVAPAVAKPAVNPNEQIEKQFVEFALMRADVHSVSKKPSKKAVVAALHSFCEDGKSFKLTSSAAFNENMAVSAERSYCDYLTK